MKVRKSFSLLSRGIRQAPCTPPTVNLPTDVRRESGRSESGRSGLILKGEPDPPPVAMAANQQHAMAMDAADGVYGKDFFLPVSFALSCRSLAALTAAPSAARSRRLPPCTATLRHPSTALLPCTRLRPCTRPEVRLWKGESA